MKCPDISFNKGKPNLLDPTCLFSYWLPVWAPFYRKAPWKELCVLSSVPLFHLFLLPCLLGFHHPSSTNQSTLVQVTDDVLLLNPELCSSSSSWSISWIWYSFSFLPSFLWASRTIFVLSLLFLLFLHFASGWFALFKPCKTPVIHLWHLLNLFPVCLIYCLIIFSSVTFYSEVGRLSSVNLPICWFCFLQHLVFCLLPLLGSFKTWWLLFCHFQL